MVALSLLSSLLFVILNAFSIWMVSTLISTIMNPGESVTPTVLKTASLHEKMEGLTSQLIGNGPQLEQLKMLCLILVLSYFLKIELDVHNYFYENMKLNFEKCDLYFQKYRLSFFSYVR